jgi:hypothetical protein
MRYYYWLKCFSQSINQFLKKMSWTFARARSFFLVHIKLFFSNYLSSFFFSCSFLRSFNVSQRLTVNTIVYINTFLFLRMERKELNSSANWYQYISKLHLVFLWITSFFFYMQERRIEMIFLSVSLTDSSFAFYSDIPSFSHSVCTEYYFRKILFFFFSLYTRREREKFELNKSIWTNIDCIS